MGWECTEQGGLASTCDLYINYDLSGVGGPLQGRGGIGKVSPMAGTPQLSPFLYWDPNRRCSVSSVEITKKWGEGGKEKAVGDEKAVAGTNFQGLLVN